MLEVWGHFRSLVREPGRPTLVRPGVENDGPGVKVSWQVTGIRKDAFAEQHRIPVEQDKPQAERGRCLYPEACGGRN